MGTTNPAKAAANRRNSKLSSGPRTARGKKFSSLNSLRHGLTSKVTVLPSEDKAAFQNLEQRLHADLLPVGDLEVVLVDRIASLLWRLRRIVQIEAGILVVENREAKRDTHLHWNPFEAANSGLTEEQTARYLELATLGNAFRRDARGANALSKLSRYETTLERSLYRALHELQRLQAARSGATVPPPAVVDVDVMITEAKTP